MQSQIDAAILRALCVPPSTNAHISTHGGSGFASTYKITTDTTSFFLKTSSAAGAKVMFEGEHASLNAIHDAVPSLCPKALAWGAMEKGGGYFLATEFLELGGSARPRSTAGKGGERGSEMPLSTKLAKLHSTPAPVPKGYEKPMFGFPVTTCCGNTPQANTFESDWATFFGKHRLLMILERCEKNQGPDAELRRTVERTVNEVVPRLLGKGHLGGKEGIQPVVCHGDLWSGNENKGSFVGRDTHSPNEPGAVEDVVFDPSAVYGHNEYDHGIMSMFGGFGESFFKEYFTRIEKTEPKDEYQDRVRLYEAYHHLNHHAMFSGYKSGAIRLLKQLLKRHGNKEEED